MVMKHLSYSNSKGGSSGTSDDDSDSPKIRISNDSCGIVLVIARGNDACMKPKILVIIREHAKHNAVPSSMQACAIG